MKNLKPYQDNCFEIHKEAVNKKQKSDLKNRLIQLNPEIEVEYKKFLEKFSSNKLESLFPNKSLAASKDDLLTLYRYQSSVIISVREKIRKLQIRTIVSTCQNCTIDSVNTLDHLLPKSNFPEFIVNPKNLFPCCTTCNDYKLDSFNKGNIQKFLNLYLDDLPNQQYLFVEVFLDNNHELDFRYYIDNIENKIEPELFAVIKSHYSNLHLFERMKLKSIEYISELENRIITFKKRLSHEVVLSDLIKAANDDKEAYGYNHWKCILEISLLNSEVFMRSLKST
jgi:hypothetical protein